MKTSSAQTFTPNSSSPQRFYILDFVRLVAMVLMMQGHTLDALVMPEHLNVAVFPWNLWHFLRGLTAPIFLMLSGAVQVFASKRDDSGSIGFGRYMKQVRWALTLIGIGYLMVFPANKLRDLPYVSPEGWHFFFQVNILQLSGLTLLGVMTVMYLTRSTLAFARVSFAIGLVLTLLSPLAYQADWFALLPEVFASYCSPKHGSLFTIFPYSAYMFFGVSIGAWLHITPAAEREQRFPQVALVLGCVLMVLGLAATYAPIAFYPPHDYYLASPNFVALRVGCAFVIMSGLTYIYRFTRQFEHYYSRLGKKSLYIYTSHLILLFGTPWFGGIARLQPHSLGLPVGALAAALVIASTLGSAYLLDYYQRHSAEVRVGLRYSLTAVLLYALLV
jgi:uncharacterized membrane protein